MAIAIDKSKIEQEAVKLVQKGQFARAVMEYQKLLAADPKDVRARVKLLDLYGKMGRKAEAVEECKRVADSYASQGFLPRAVAVLKQGQRIDPENSDLYNKLGEYYLQQKLTGDAIAVFKSGVDKLLKQGRVIEASATLKKMADLAPDNIAIKIHLAELHLSLENTDDFYREVEKIVAQLKKEGRARKLLQVLEGLYEKSGKSPVLTKPMADLYIELGEDQKALGIIADGLSAKPGDRDLRLGAIRANLALGNLTDAKKVAMGLHDEEPSNIFILEQLDAIAQAQGDVDEVVRWNKALAKLYGKMGSSSKEEYHYKKVLEYVPDDAEVAIELGSIIGTGASTGQNSGLGGEFLFDIEGVLLPEAGPQSSSQQVESKKPGREHSYLGDGLIEVDLYVKYGLDDKAKAKLLELSSHASDSIEVRQKLRDLYRRIGDNNAWLEEQLNVAGLLMNADKEGEALRAYEAVLELFPGNQEAKHALGRLRGEDAEEKPADVEIELEPLEMESFIIPTSHGDHGPSSYSAPKPEVSQQELNRGLMEVDDLIDNEEEGEAMSVLLRLHEFFPEDPRVVTRLKALGWSGELHEVVELEPEAEPETFPQAAPEGEDFADIKAELGHLEFDISSSIAGFEEVEVGQLDDIVREFKSGVAEKLDESDYETHYDLGVAYREMGLLEDALHEFQKAAKFVERAKNAYTSIAMVYRETNQLNEARQALRMALSVPSNSDEDRAAILYEIGCLCEEQGDYEGALSSFEKVASLSPSHRDVGSRIGIARAWLGK